MLLGPSVDDIEHGMHRFGRDEAECFLHYRVDDRMQAVLNEGLVVSLGLPNINVAQPGFDVSDEVGDHAGRPFRA